MLSIAILYGETSFAQNSTRVINSFTVSSDRNKNFLESFQKAKLNCCDARYELKCNESMHPTSQTEGLSVLSLKWSDGQSTNIIPLSLERRGENSYKIKAIGGGSLEYLQEMERTLEIDGDHINRVGQDGKKFAIKTLAPTTLEVATSIHPFNSGAITKTIWILQTSMSKV